MAYEELKPNYLSQLISRYKYMVGVTAALKKDPVHQRIMKTAKRLREEDYDDDESMQYAIKKRKFLIERKLDEYDPLSYEEDEVQAQTLSLPYKAPMKTLPYKPINSKKCKCHIFMITFLWPRFLHFFFICAYSKTNAGNVAIKTWPYCHPSLLIHQPTVLVWTKFQLCVPVSPCEKKDEFFIFENWKERKMKKLRE